MIGMDILTKTLGQLLLNRLGGQRGWMAAKGVKACESLPLYGCGWKSQTG